MASALLGWQFFSVGGGWAPTSAPLWTALVSVSAVLGGLTLVTFVPRPGQRWRNALRCTPCSILSAVMVLMVPWFLSSAAHDPMTALVAAVLTGFALARQVTTGTSCTI